MGEAGGYPEESSPRMQGTLESLVAQADDPIGLSLPFVQRLSEADRQALVALACREWCARGTVICQEGDPGETLYLIESGQVAVVKEVGSGRPTLLGYRGAGELIGEMSVVSEQPRSASVITVEGTELLSIGAAEFSALMAERPGIGWAVLNVLNDRLYAADVARTRTFLEEQVLARRVERLTDEAERLAELARVRQETVELIVHDLRTPLAVINGCMEMLRATLSGKELGVVSGMLQLAERSSERLLVLVEDLLEAGRQETTAGALASQPVDLARVLRHAVAEAGIVARQAGIDLDLALPPDLPQPQGDKVQLQRVMGNLLDNAVSYTPAGGWVRVSARAGEDEVEVSVTDNGPGVPPEHRDKIFNRFTRVPGAEGRRQGFGLGLYFCSLVVDAHGGRIWVEPGPGGKGSRFAFALPLAGRPLRT
jgi:signal transduction histidine kinase